MKYLVMHMQSISKSIVPYAPLAVAHRLISLKSTHK